MSREVASVQINSKQTEDVSKLSVKCLFQSFSNLLELEVKVLACSW